MARRRSQTRYILRLYAMLPDGVHVVRAGYKDALFTQPVIPGTKPVQIVYAEKLSGAKGVPWMPRALFMVDALGWILHLVGGRSGTEQSECLKLADDLGKQLTFHGAVSQNQLAEIRQFTTGLQPPEESR